MKLPATKCPGTGCKARIPKTDMAAETRAVCIDGQWWHRWCHFKTTRTCVLVEQLFNLQDDPVADPETALADLIGDLAQFAKLKHIDFESAAERGMRYAEEET